MGGVWEGCGGVRGVGVKKRMDEILLVIGKKREEGRVRERVKKLGRSGEWERREKL